MVQPLLKETSPEGKRNDVICLLLTIWIIGASIAVFVAYFITKDTSIVLMKSKAGIFANLTAVKTSEIGLFTTSSDVPVGRVKQGGIGRFIGYVETESHVYYFATGIGGPSVTGPKA